MVKKLIDLWCSLVATRNVLFNITSMIIIYFMYLSSFQTLTVMCFQLHVSLAMIKAQFLPVVEGVFLKQHALMVSSNPAKGIAEHYWH